MKNTITSILVIISFFSCMIVHFLSPSIPVFSISTDRVAAYYPNYFSPADFTFIICNVIFILTGAFTFYQYKLSEDSLLSNESLYLVRICFIVYGIFNFIWLLSWYYYFLALSTMTLLVISAFLGYICRVINKSDLSIKDRLFIKIPFSILYGWISITTVMNFVILMESIRWKNFGLPHFIWVLLLFIAVALVAVMQTFMNKDITYGLTIIWSYIGILVRHLLYGAENPYRYAVPVLIVCIITLSGSVVYLTVREGLLHKYRY